MKRLPWPPWKFWNRAPVSSKRRIHLGPAIEFRLAANKRLYGSYHNGSLSWGIVLRPAYLLVWGLFVPVMGSRDSFLSV
jgi:hypothetical protein